MLAKWGAAAAAVVVLGVAQPSLPTPPPDAPTLDIPIPTGPGISLDPTRPSEPPAGPRPVPLLPQSLNIAIKVLPDGRLSVTEQVFVQARRTMTRRAPLRIQAGDDRDRVFTVHDVRVDGNGSTEVTADEFVLRLDGGATTVTYTVDGAVVDTGDRQEVRWQVAGGWDVDIRLLRASFVAPDLPSRIVCLAGRLGSDAPCESALTDHGQVLRVVQQDLAAGERVDLEVTLPAGTVGGNARFDAAARPSAFAMTTVSGLGLGILALVMAGGFVLLWLARGRDTRALAADVGAVELLVTDGGRVAFASPDGVLPGEVGTVVDEHVDVADVTATVVDLAVRNYLSIRQAGEDWVLVRRNPADDALTGYERAVYTALLAGADDDGEVTLAALRQRGPDFGPVREELYAGVVGHDWFTRRPDHERTRWMLVGVLLAVAGVAVTVVLALTVGHALLGLAVVAGGLGLAVGARLMPARTRRGSVLVAQVRGLLGFLRGDLPPEVPAEDREMVLSRSLPYAVVLGETETWLTHFAGLDRLYWYEGDIGAFPAFLRELDAVLAAAGRLR